MSVPSDPPADDRPGVGKIVLTLVVTLVFVARAVWWWVGIANGTKTIESTTTAGWIRLGIVHLGAIGGPILVAGMIRARLRAAKPAPPPAEPGPGAPTGETG